MIGAIYQGGKFHAFDTQQTALALSCYAIGLAGYSALKVLNPAFYALARRAHAHDHQPDLDRRKLLHRVAAAALNQSGARRPGAVHFGGGDFRGHRAVRDPEK